MEPSRMILRTQEEITSKWSATAEPLVAIRCTAFNHEKYIAECLNGFLAQETTFPFEVIVHEDASTDNTANIIREYEAKYPKIIKPIYETTNQYSKQDGSFTRIINSHLKRKYIAMCEGDDYWTDPLKLQKQVTFLESHPDYGMCYGIVRQYNQAKKAFFTNRGTDFVSFENYLKTRNNIPTLSTCYRRDLYLQFKSDETIAQQSWPMGDLPMWLWFTYNSKVKFFPEIFGVYRVLSNSAAHSSNIEKQVNFYRAGYECANFFSMHYLGKKLPPYEDHHDRARLYSTKAHDRKKAYKEYKLIPHKSRKYKILTALHSNPVTYLLLRIYYSVKYKQ